MVGATLVGVPGCADDETPDPDPIPDPPEGTFAFPQGVASGDPRAASVVVWTRVVFAGDDVGSSGAIPVRVQVSAEASFGTLIVNQVVTAARGADHTVRVLVTGLNPATTYHYRFVAGKDTISGRTRTAPAADADVQVNLAWVSCQDYTSGHYGAYRQMIADDDARPEADRIHAVVHLGDMIYETRDDGFQSALDDNFNAIMLTNRDGQPRAIPRFPSGADVQFATTVDDYRHLYRVFLSDPDLQAARARWPFVCVWDDHEFSDDAWQSQANYLRARTAEEPAQTRRMAASQAWFEYVPAHLSGAGGVAGVPSQARDFSFERVENAPFTSPNDDNLVTEPNNLAAIGAITIYRSLRFGRHVELVMTDERSYRSDHSVPEELTNNPAFAAPRGALPLPLVNILDQGKTSTVDNGRPPSEVVLVPGPDPARVAFPNVRAFSPPGTILGKRQKEWWMATMEKSDATWKLWGNEVMVMRLLLPQLGPGGSDLIVTADAWDGYSTERKELVGHLMTKNIKNVVVLTGDIHASFAGTIVDDYDKPPADRVPVAFELVASGISSNSLFSFFHFATVGTAQEPLVTVNASAAGGSAFTENFNMLLLHGLNSTLAFAGSPDRLDLALAAGVDVNPHLRYVDTNSQGYGYVKITAAQIEADLVTINRPLTVPGAAGPGHKRVAKFIIPKDSPGAVAIPEVSGTKPFPMT